MKEIAAFVCTMIPIFTLVQLSAKKFERKEKISKIFLRSLIFNAVVLCLFGLTTHELLNIFLITEYDLRWTLCLDYGLSDFWATTFAEIIVYIFVGIQEEIWKMIVVSLLIWRDPKKSNKYDFVWYCIVSASAFAVTENFLYCLAADDWVWVAVTRTFFSTGAHIFYCLVTASFVCRVVDSDSVCAKLKHAVVGVLIAGTVHCFGNTCLGVPLYLSDAGASIWVVVASLLIPLGNMAAEFIFAWNQTLWYARHAKYDNTKHRRLYLKPSPFEVGCTSPTEILS